MRRYVFLCLLLLISHPVFSQQASPAAIALLIDEGKTTEAEALLNQQLSRFYAVRNIDTLPAYTDAVGRLGIKRAGVTGGIKAVSGFVKKIKSYAPTLKQLRKTTIEAAYFYGDNECNKQAYESFLEAYKYTQQMPDKKPEMLAGIETNLGAYADRMGNMNLSLFYARKALNTYLTSKQADPEKLYQAYNNMGSQMFGISKTDSAQYYFRMALAMVGKLPRTIDNLYYRPAVIHNNLAGIYGVEGNTTEAIRAMKITIKNLGLFLASKEESTKKKGAVAFQFQAMDNLGGIYKELGDLQQARGLMEYSYAQKQKSLDSNSPEIFKSQVLLGQLCVAGRDFNRAEDYFSKSLARMKKADGDYLYWQADACNGLALLHDERGNKQLAARYFEWGDSLYNASLQGGWDNIYLDFLRNAALFYAENGDPKTGIAKAQKGYRYVLKASGAQTLPAFYQLLNLSEVCYKSGQYREALAYGNKGLTVVNLLIRSAGSTLDSIKMELKKPRAILTRAKADYALAKNKDEPYLKGQLAALGEALQVLDRRKSLINDPEDIGVLLADHAGLLEFVKKINLDLYRLTKDPQYIGSLIGLHESGLYTRIRSRLDHNDTLQFAYVPANVRADERRMKAAIATAFTGSRPHEEKLRAYLAATEAWDRYKDHLRESYPRYYALRYASIFRPLGDVQQSIPAGTTVVRYFFTGNELLALVVDKDHVSLTPLSSDSLGAQIMALSQYGMDAGKTAGTLYALYRQLWAPVAGNVRNRKVVIIPDGILYNLNFELLTPERIRSYKELAHKSLLARLSVSYHYSLFVLAQQHRAAAPSNSFIAYAPGFSDALKLSYRQRSKDSVATDRAYLNLLPQPFTVSLAAKVQDLLGGNALLNEASTESAFKANAGNHKIIHIGTHAESNNIYPEYSRLIFAKGNGERDEDNSLFMPEIYNCDLTSNLTVLTACESGRPGYRDGEGMISLAHAFNYAGSESILTGLWKIDEQASALIMEAFYKNLLAGMPKDEALRAAKLTYLAGADTRMQAPQYWAGLVLMGDMAPIALEAQRSSAPWLIGGGAGLLCIAGYWLMRRRARRKLRA